VHAAKGNKDGCFFVFPSCFGKTQDRGRFAVVHPHLTFSVQRWARPPQNKKDKDIVKLGVFSVFAPFGEGIKDSDNIWHVSRDHGSTPVCQIWPGSVKG